MKDSLRPARGNETRPAPLRRAIVDPIFEDAVDHGRNHGGHYYVPTTIAAPKTKAAPATEEDFLPLQGTDYIEFYVGNARQAAHFYKTAFGFQSLAYSGPETGTKDRASYAIRQNKLTFVLTTPVRQIFFFFFLAWPCAKRATDRPFLSF